MDKQKILDKIAELEKQVSDLKEEVNKPESDWWYKEVPAVPVTPPFNPWKAETFPTWPPPKPKWDKCPKCAIQLESVMMYVCHCQDCPTGLGDKTTC